MDDKTRYVIAIAVLIVVALAGVAFWANKPRATGSATGVVTGMSQGFSSNEEMMAAHHPQQAKASTQGFSSNEEMMEAHHGKGASGSGGGVGGCGAEAQPASHDSPVQGSGETSAYGITYDNAGYQQLLGDAKSITLDADQTKLIVGLDASIPCCGFKNLQASGNCECGHHQALYGLAKLLASKSYSREQIQGEMNKWKEVFYPGGGSGSTGGC